MSGKIEKKFHTFQQKVGANHKEIEIKKEETLKTDRARIPNILLAFFLRTSNRPNRKKNLK